MSDSLLKWHGIIFIFIFTSFIVLYYFYSSNSWNFKYMITASPFPCRDNIKKTWKPGDFMKKSSKNMFSSWSLLFFLIPVTTTDKNLLQDLITDVRWISFHESCIQYTTSVIWSYFKTFTMLSSSNLFFSYVADFSSFEANNF